MKRALHHTVLASLLLAAICPAWSEQLGSIGQTYGLDRDGREQLKDIARQKQESGELDAYWREYRQKVEESVRHPAPLGIKSSYATRTERHELKFVVPQDYTDGHGHTVAKRGTVIEPLKINPLKSGLIFIDGRDQAQIDYAIRKGLTQSFRIVLTAGSPIELRTKYQHAKWRTGTGIPFYFDQKKMIIRTLKFTYGISIDSVPATLYQQGNELAIDFGVSP